MSRFRKADKADILAGFRPEKAEAIVPSGLLKAARKSGQLNLTGRGLTEGSADPPWAPGPAMSDPQGKRYLA